MTDVLCGQAEHSKILALRTNSSVTRQSSHNEQRQHLLAAVVRIPDRWATGMKTAMTRQCNIKSEDGDYPDRLDDDAYTSGPKWYSLKSVASVHVCVCVFSYAWWTAHSRWLKTEALWGRMMEANRVIVVLCWTKLVNCNSAQPKIPLHPPLFSLNLPQGVSTKFYKTVKIGHITNFWRSCWLERLWLLLYCLC